MMYHNKQRVTSPNNATTNGCQASKPGAPLRTSAAHSNISGKSMMRMLGMGSLFATNHKKKPHSSKVHSEQSLGGVYATLLTESDNSSCTPKSHNSLETAKTHDTEHSEHNDPVTPIDLGKCSTWSSSGKRTHHRGAPVIVPRSASLMPGPGPILKQQSRRNIFIAPSQEEPVGVILDQVMASAKLLPQDTDYIASNHVMINSERVERRIQPLVRLPLLDEIAKKQAETMAEKGELFHSDPDVLMKAINRPSQRLGENVCKGSTIRGMHTTMLKNASDKNNIIDRRFTSFGIGTGRDDDGTLYLCQVFRG